MNEAQQETAQPNFRDISTALTVYFCGSVLIAVDLIVDTG